MLQVIRLRDGDSPARYQLNYTVAGNSYGRTFADDVRLTDFLRTKAYQGVAVVDRVLHELQLEGRTTIPDVEIPVSHATEIGLEQIPSES